MWLRESEEVQSNIFIILQKIRNLEVFYVFFYDFLGESIVFKLNSVREFFRIFSWNWGVFQGWQVFCKVISLGMESLQEVIVGSIVRKFYGESNKNGVFRIFVVVFCNFFSSQCFVELVVFICFEVWFFRKVIVRQMFQIFSYCIFIYGMMQIFIVCFKVLGKFWIVSQEFF